MNGMLVYNISRYYTQKQANS